MEIYTSGGYASQRKDKDKDADYEELSKRCAQIDSEWSAQYEHMRSDLLFLSGGQSMWDAGAYKVRMGEGRPCFSLPMLRPYVSRIVSSVRQSPPEIAVLHENSELQEAICGLMRSLERSSSSYEAYSQAMFNAVATGIGWLRVALEEDFREDLQIKIKGEKDPTRIAIDPYSIEPDGRDAKFAVHYGSMPKHEAIEHYGKGVESQSKFDRPTIRTTAFPFPKDHIPDVTYYYLTDEGCKICRWVGSELIQEQLIPDLKWLPIVPVYGQSVLTHSGRKYQGIVADGRDVNSALNIVISNAMEFVNNVPKSPFIAPASAIEDFQEEWRDCNVKTFATLRYNPYDKSGNPLPAPIRLDTQPLVQSLQGMGDWIRGLLPGVTGVSDQMLGMQSSMQESGAAIVARMAGAEGAGVALYVDHLTTSITQLGRVIMALLPMVYVGPRQIPLIDEYGRASVAQLDISSILTPDIVQSLEVECQSGPNSEMKQKEGAQNLVSVIQSLGASGIGLTDILAKSMDLPDAEKVEKRIKGILSSQGIDINDDGEGEDIDPRAKQAMLLAQQHIDQVMQDSQQKDQTIIYLQGQMASLQQQINAQTDALKVSMEQARIKSETDMYKADLDAQTKLTLAGIKAHADEALEDRANRAKLIDHTLSLAKEHASNVMSHEMEVAKLPISVMKSVAEADNGNKQESMSEDLKQTAEQ